MAEFTKFDIYEYDPNSFIDGMLNADGESSLANKGMVIEFTHVPTGNVVAFKAFITAFNETYGSDWSSEVVYGRADPIMLFKNTTRKITLAFKIPAMTEGEAYQNLGKVQMLTQFLYPTYKDSGLAQTITQSPLVRLKVMNLLQNTEGLSNEGTDATDMYLNYQMGGSGLLGAIGNLTVNHNLEGDHGIVEKGTAGTFEAALPKLLEINLDFSPIHEHPLGWDAENKFGTYGDAQGELFPYGVSLSDASDAASSDDQAEEATPTEAASQGADDEMPTAGAGENETQEEQAPDPELVEGSGAWAEAAVAEERATAVANLGLSEVMEDLMGPDNSASGIEAREKAETRATLEENMRALRDRLGQ